MIEDIYNTTGTSQTNRLSIKELHDIFVYTQSLLMKNTIPFEDVSGYLYMKDRIHGSANQTQIKYLVVDEAQDYTIMQYKVLANLFRNAKVTILGDLNQNITPFANYQNYDTILQKHIAQPMKSICLQNTLLATQTCTIKSTAMVMR